MEDISGKVQDAIDELCDLDEEMHNLIWMLEYHATGIEKGAILDSEVLSRSIRHIKKSVENMRVTLESGMSAVALIRK